MRNERGATMVEASIVASLLILVLLLICDTALFMRSRLAARSAATAGARAGAVAGVDPAADYEILHEVGRSAVGTGNKSLSKVIVYKASSATSEVPSACLSGPVAQLCNVYDNDDLQRPESDFTDGSWTGNSYWLPSSRSVRRSTGTSFVGVYVAMTNTSITSLFPGTLTYSAVTAAEATQF